LAITYNGLLKIMVSKNITTYTLRKQNIISQDSWQKIRTGRGSIDTRTINRLCKALGCQPGDLMEYVEDA